jgi:hypothetical protein
MADTSLQFYHDHYKDTFSYIRDCERQRNNLFVFVLIMLGLQVLQLRLAITLQALLKEVNVSGISISLSKIPSDVFVSIVWVLLSVFIMRYYQVTLHIEKQYDYLHKVESDIERLLGGQHSFCRESTGYLTKKGFFFRHWAWLFYTLFMPLIIIGAILWCLVLEWNTALPPVGQICFDAFSATVSVICIILYLIAIWGKR